MFKESIVVFSYMAFKVLVIGVVIAALMFLIHKDSENSYQITIECIESGKQWINGDCIDSNVLRENN